MSVAFLAGWRADNQPLALPGASSVSIPATGGTVIPLAEIEALHGNLAGTVFPDSARHPDFAADPRRTSLLRQSLS